MTEMSSYCALLLQALEEDLGGVTLTLVSPSNPARLGERVYVDAQGNLRWPPPDSPSNEDLVMMARELRIGSPITLEIKGAGTVLAEPVSQGPRVFLMGAGSVSQALSRILAVLKYHTEVVDEREGFAQKSLFPPPVRVHCRQCAGLLDALDVGGRTFVVIATHSHAIDYECLVKAIGKRAGYVGMLGSRRKIQSFLARLKEEGITQAGLSQVHAPVGVDIGARRPEEIAVSIAAEIVCVNNRSGGESLDPQWLKQVTQVREPAVIATLFDTQGETPRQRGARLMVTASGKVTGSIGGGAGEAAVLEAAGEVAVSGLPRLLTVDLLVSTPGREETEAYGTIRVLLEFVSPNGPEMIYEGCVP